MSIDSARTAVFLCQCGKKIAPFVDLEILQDHVAADNRVAHCETLPYACIRPGIEHIMQAVAAEGINRLIIAGCEGRLMARKFSAAFQPLGFHKEQIDMVNLRGHIAAVSPMSPQDNALKGAKLIKAAAAEMAVLAPTLQTLAHIKGPVIIVGGGIASFSAARELQRHDIELIMAFPDSDPQKVVRRLHQRYPGDQAYAGNLLKLVQEVAQSGKGTFLTDMSLTALSGVTGEYTLTFVSHADQSEHKLQAGAVVACIDAALTAPGPEFGYNGENVITLPEMGTYILEKGAPKGSIVFWINDYELGTPDLAALSARSAWSMACHIRQSSPASQVILLYNPQMAIPLTAAERALNRKAGIHWIPYDQAVRPTLQDGYVTFCHLADHVEQEIKWDLCVLSPQRGLDHQGRNTAGVLGLLHKDGRFLASHHARVRPEMVGREETYLAGSGRYPCDLQEALHQGRRAGKKTAEMIKKAQAGELYVPRVVCVVDPNKCIGCGQCQELCDCGGIGVAEDTRGGLPRVVDPMVCTGGGTCAAACPYHALVLQNNTNDQREARVAALAREMGSDQVVAFACAWGGLPAADNAGQKGLTYDPRIHILGVPCVGQIDPCVMARALLEGATGLLLIGCLPEECHHSYGVDHAWTRINAIKKLLSLCGFDRRRIALAHADLNRPQEFIKTIESYTHTLAALGPIPPTPENRGKLQALYDLIKYNTRVRHLISASLRRPWEKSYRGEQVHALDYDRDFSEVVAEEFLQQRLKHLLRDQKKGFRLHEMAIRLQADEQQIADCLWDMVNSGTIKYVYENRVPCYSLHN